MLKKLVPSVVLVVALTFGAAACSSTDVPASKFQSELQSKAKLTPTEASCVTTQTYHKLSTKDVNKLYTASANTDLPSGVENQFLDILQGCITKQK